MPKEMNDILAEMLQVKPFSADKIDATTVVDQVVVYTCTQILGAYAYVRLDQAYLLQHLIMLLICYKAKDFASSVFLGLGY